MSGFGRAASRFLVRGGYVYQEGGEPAYFGTPSDKCDTAKLPLRIGGLQVGCNRREIAGILGSQPNQRRRAAYRSFVFHVDEVDEVDEACSALKSEGLRPGFEESATIVDGATRRMESPRAKIGTSGLRTSSGARMRVPRRLPDRTVATPKSWKVGKRFQVGKESSLPPASSRGLLC
jgi:hypothetical protein